MNTRRAAVWRVVPWLLVTVVAAGAAGAAVQGATTSRRAPPRVASPPPAYFPLTGFGGYRIQGKVSEIEAEWRVPTITNMHQPGAEATWIGAQGPAADEPFIQLGTEGFVLTTPFLGAGSGNSADSPSAPSLNHAVYEVFWSDTTERFSPVPIVQLRRPGDLILFKMRRGASGWRLTVKNLTVGWSRAVTVSYGLDDSFSQGEWTQEDPGGDSPGTDYPYAVTSSVSFQRVLLNGKIPKLRYPDEGALSSQDGVYLVPTALLDDGFSMVVPTGPALRYLSDAESVDASLFRIGAHVALTGRDGGTADATQIQGIKQMAVAYRTSIRSAQAQTWPSSARPAIKRFVATQQALVLGLSEWIASKQHSLRQLDAVFKQNESFQIAVNNLRRDLGVPPI